MTELELQTLWQDQPEEPFTARHLDDARAAVDWAVPTSRFEPAQRRARGPLVAVGLALAAAATFLLWPTAPLSPAPAVQVDRGAQLEALLVECRTLTSGESGAIDWDRALAACDAALEEEPLHPEALELLARLKKERACQTLLAAADAQRLMGRLEESLSSLTQLDPACAQTFARATELATPLAAEVKQRAGRDCEQLAAAQQWGPALPRCELYARLACQQLAPSELAPPEGKTLKLEGPLNARSWRPADPRFTAFLRVRQHLRLQDTWVCPVLPMLKPRAPRVDPDALARAELAQRYAEPVLNQALLAYFRGDFQAARPPVQALTEQMSKAQHHAAARALLLDLNIAIGFFENGTGALLEQRPEQAAQPFREALALDERLVLGERATTLAPEEKRQALKARASFLRRGVEERMGRATLEKGRLQADRKDFRGACLSWKLGLSFTRGNLDLLRAVTNICTRRAASILEGRPGCADLASARDFAVDGDGLAERIAQAQRAQDCR